MTSGRWALLVGVIIATLGFLAFRPVDCIGVPDGRGMDPSGFHKVCATPIGVELQLPYNSDPTSRDGSFSAHSGPTRRNDLPVVMVAALAGAAAALITFVVLSIRRRGLDDVLSFDP